MPAKNPRTLDVRSHEQWRNWLQEHHDREAFGLLAAGKKLGLKIGFFFRK